MTYTWNVNKIFLNSFMLLHLSLLNASYKRYINKIRITYGPCGVNVCEFKEFFIVFSCVDKQSCMWGITKCLQRVVRGLTFKNIEIPLKNKYFRCLAIHLPPFTLFNSKKKIGSFIIDKSNATLIFRHTLPTSLALIMHTNELILKI